MSSFVKDLHRLMKRVKRLTDGQVTIKKVDWDNTECVDNFNIVIKPNAGYYKGGIFEFEVYEDGSYDCGGPPGIICNSNILHPNIDPADSICLNILDSEHWLPSIGLEGAVLGLLFLLHNPNFDDPLNGSFSDLSDIEREKQYKEYYNGEVDGYEFIKEGDSNERLESGEAVDSATKDKCSEEDEAVAMEVDNGAVMDVETAVRLHNFPTPSIAEEQTESACALPRSASLRQCSMDRVPLKSSQSCFPNFSQNVDFFKTKPDEPKLVVCDGETVLMY